MTNNFQPPTKQNVISALRSNLPGKTIATLVASYWASLPKMIPIQTQTDPTYEFAKTLFSMPQVVA